MSDVIDEHRLYLSDGPRLDAYARALTSVVRHGDVVVDLGAGSGIMGMLACRAGARKVYALEHTSLVGLTRQIAAENGLDDRIEHIKELSTRVSLPERADVVVCDQIGRFGFEAGVFGYFADAARRFARDDARYLPSHIEFYVAPVSVPERAADVAFWERPVHGFHFTSANEVARNSGYPCRLERSHLLGPEACVLRRATTSAEPFGGSVELTIERAGVLDGLGGFFRAELAPDVFVTNSPLAEARIDRRNVLLPIAASTPVEVGDRIGVRMHFIPSETMLSWSVRIERGGGLLAESHHSTFKGMFIAREDMQRSAPDSLPRLTPRGRARRTVLQMCDGEHTLQQIEQQVAEQHAELFESSREVSRFVADVVARYANIG